MANAHRRKAGCMPAYPDWSLRGGCPANAPLSSVGVVGQASGCSREKDAAMSFDKTPTPVQTKMPAFLGGVASGCGRTLNRPWSRLVTGSDCIRPGSTVPTEMSQDRQAPRC